VPVSARALADARIGVCRRALAAKADAQSHLTAITGAVRAVSALRGQKKERRSLGGRDPAPEYSALE